MSNHIGEWIHAYLDGELRDSRLQQVEAHLAECDVCKAELQSLRDLSALLHEVATPEFTAPERFAAQVNLRLPRRLVAISTNRIFEISWWMVPAGLLAAWVFIGTAFFVSDMLSAASRLGLLSGISDWLASGSSNDIYLSTTIGQMGLLNGSGLNWAEAVETFTRVSLPEITLQISIALLYLSWIAVWWARHTHNQRQQHGQLLES